MSSLLLALCLVAQSPQAAPKPTPDDLLLARTILSAPVGTPEAVPDESRWPTAAEALRRACVELELIGPGWASALFYVRADYQTDLDIVRQLKADLDDAPPLSVANRFPSRAEAAKQKAFNREYLKFLEEKLLWEDDRSDLIRPAIEETERLHRAWDEIEDTQSWGGPDPGHIASRRLALKKAVLHLGPNGELPPNVPHWLFQKETR